VTAATVDTPFTLRRIEEMLGLGRSAILGLVQAGFVTPRRGPRNEYQFSFQDIVLLRTAHHLRAAEIPPRQLLRSLKELKARLPDAMPLSGLRITAVGKDVAVREGNVQWEAGSGQLLMDFEITSEAGSVAILQRQAEPTRPAAHRTAAGWFGRGEELEGTDPLAAESAYRQALSQEPGHAFAAVNLGALLCERGRCAEAVELYQRAIERAPAVPLLHFNLAIALEDQHRHREAIESYERCLSLAPELADAHYNLARLHEQLDEPQAALRHYSAYRRLQIEA
jgi:tetratricopeptide (TPR) repeat protein